MNPLKASATSAFQGLHLKIVMRMKKGPGRSSAHVIEKQGRIGSGSGSVWALGSATKPFRRAIAPDGVDGCEAGIPRQPRKQRATIAYRIFNDPRAHRAPSVWTMTEAEAEFKFCYQSDSSENNAFAHSAAEPQPKSKAKPEILKHGGNGGGDRKGTEGS